jgi:hypothetical protein
LQHELDVRAVTEAAAAGCQGAYLGGNFSSASSNDLWTIHCSSTANADQMIENLRAQLEDVGMTITDSGSIVAPTGEAMHDVNFEGDELRGTARLIVIPAGDGQAIALTIDQTTR